MKIRCLFGHKWRELEWFMTLATPTRTATDGHMIERYKNGTS